MYLFTLLSVSGGFRGPPGVFIGVLLVVLTPALAGLVSPFSGVCLFLNWFFIVTRLVQAIALCVASRCIVLCCVRGSLIYRRLALCLIAVSLRCIPLTLFWITVSLRYIRLTIRLTLSLICVCL
ncbi:hypothetical protein F5Y09DRAFT_314219 [Xylaria sp. FL1042]|nr:hypothetical protein F5Y09DRAFT_314219 [Xylaria sp. FL1042]